MNKQPPNLPFKKSLLVSALLLNSVNYGFANGGINYQDIATDPSSGITYRRIESPRDAVFDALKAQPVLTFPEAALIPMKSHGAPGVAIFDYDKDGDMDIYVSNGPGRANSLYSNQFNETGVLSFVDKAVMAGVAATDLDSTGVCYGDIDNDGDHDLYVLGTGSENRLFENQGDGSFIDITGSSQLGSGVHNPSGCSMGDVNGDGMLDVVIANTWGDWDNRIAIFDAFGDMEHNQLFVNQGDNTFTDVSDSSGIKELTGLSAELDGLGTVTWSIAMVDYDADGDIDIVMADDQAEVLEPAFGGYNRGMLHVLNNDGTGHFTDVNVETGLNKTGAWMGLSFGDLNSDGRLDMFVSNLGDYMFTITPRPAPYQLGELATRWFLAQADGTFSDPGVGDLVSTPFSWGNVMTDYDNDGDLDLVTQGGLDVGPFIEASNPGVIMQNDGDAHFVYDQDALSLSTNHSRRNVQGLAAGDLNQDGFVDLVSVSSLDMPEPLPLVPYPLPWGSDLDATASIFPSFTTPTPEGTFSYNGMEPAEGSLSVEISNADNGNHWTSVELVGAKGLIAHGKVNRDGIGAIVKFKPEHGEEIMKPVLGGGSYASQDSLVANLGMAKSEEGTLEVLWPGGVKNRLYDVQASEHIVFPEIPCSYENAEHKQGKYQQCVTQALHSLRKQGVIDEKQSQRFLISAIKAYRETHKHHKKDS